MLPQIANTVFAKVRFSGSKKIYSNETSTSREEEVIFEKEDLHAHKKLKTIKSPRIVFNGGHIKAVTSLCLIEAPGKCPIIVSGGEDKIINLWSIETGCNDLLVTLKGHTARVSCLSTCRVNSQGTAIALVSGSWDETLIVWDISSIYDVIAGEIKADQFANKSKSIVLKGHKNRVSGVECPSIKFGDNEKRCVISVSYDNTIRVWHIIDDMFGENSIEFKYKIVALQETWWLCMKYYLSIVHGPIVLTGGKDHTLRVWKLMEPESKG